MFSDWYFHVICRLKLYRQFPKFESHIVNKQTLFLFLLQVTLFVRLWWLFWLVPIESMSSVVLRYAITAWSARTSCSVFQLVNKHYKWHLIKHKSPWYYLNLERYQDIRDKDLSLCPSACCLYNTCMYSWWYQFEIQNTAKFRFYQNQSEMCLNLFNIFYAQAV